ncbi:unnamed protein product [Blepharisma stoltei]|uniref:Peptidase M14 domain-containing protein n=1 Tax=Blepharisma stoltei TaxID=1481888 RepID=A0AAU9K0J7_9CILI|nr:unnamed protein product [Blepharisma stoltei]
MEAHQSHCIFRFPEENIEISSDFDSGNLIRAEKQEPTKFFLWICTDSPNTNARGWFYFKVSVSELQTLTFHVKNIGNLTNLYKFGFRPVFSYDKQNWERITSDFTAVPTPEGTEISFSHYFAEDSAYFAFTYPWSYEDNQNFLDSISNPNIYIFRENLISSVEGRKCDYLAISSFKGILETDMMSNGPKEFSEKQLIVISARVHAAESGSSFMMNGLIKFLLSEDPRAIELLDNFVFLLVPMLNPDGVYKGNMRFDTLGQNLNRFYSDPIISLHPTIFAIKELIVHNKERIFCYIDLHAHASIKGIFIFGNYMNDFKKQVETCLFPKLMEINNVNFHWEQCNFSDENMKAHDKNGDSREGSGRVGIFKAAGLLRCYTLECNYHSGITTNNIPSPGIEESLIDDRNSVIYNNGSPAYDIKIFENVGKSICVSILDLIEKNQYSRLRVTEFQSIEDFKVHVAENVAKLVPYRYFNEIRKIGKNKNALRELLCKKEEKEGNENKAIAEEIKVNENL